MKTPCLTAKELAAALKVSEKSIRRAYQNGEIPVQRICRFVRFSLDQVMRAMAERGNRRSMELSQAKKQRSATGGDSRRRAQRKSPRVGNTGALTARILQGVY